MHWSNVQLYGAASISKLCSIYEIQDLLRVPDGKYKIKILQRGEHDFIALPNVCVRSEAGTPEWTSGSGDTELEALQNALKALSSDLDALKGNLQRERFEWSDPVEF